MSKWMDIETAPKDGARILTVTSFAGEPGVFIVKWDNRIPAWVLDGFGGNITVSPTLWMPLPRLPQPDMV